MRVLILSQYFYPETFRINEVAQSLTKLGCEVTVLTGQPNYPGGVTFAGYRAWGFRRESYFGCPVYRVPSASRGRGGAMRLILNYLSFVLSASLFGPFVLRKHRFDVIFVYGISPILQAIPGMVLRWFCGGALIVWVQDLWPQSLEATGFVKKPRLLAAVAAIVRWIYRRSDLLLAQSRAFIPEVETMAGGTPVKYQPNPGELSFDAAWETRTSDIVLNDGFNIVFAGNLGTVQSLETLLNAAEILKDQTDIRFVFIGSGSRGDWALAETRRRNLANVEFKGRVPPESIPAILAQASALLVSLVRNPIMSQTVPSKVQAYLAAGRPIVASLDGEGARVIEEANAGISCPAEDAHALANAVVRLRDATPEERSRMGEAGRRYYREHFDPILLSRQLITIFRQAIHLRQTGRISG